MDEDTGSVPGAISGASARDVAQQMRQRALQASDKAAAGALLMGLVSLMVRSDD